MLQSHPTHPVTYVTALLVKMMLKLPTFWEIELCEYTKLGFKTYDPNKTFLYPLKTADIITVF